MVGMKQAVEDVGLDEPLPEDPRLVAARAEGWRDFDGESYSAFCQNCNNAAGLMVRQDRSEPPVLEVICKGCLVFGHPSFAEDEPGELYVEAEGELIDRGDYDPVRDEKREFTLREWAGQLKRAVDGYVEDFEGANDFHKGKHTWLEWMGSFARYMSW